MQTPAVESVAPGVDLSIVAPCYNEEEGLAEFYRRATLAMQSTKLAHEIVLVNDGSRDGTWPMMCELAAADPRIVAVNLSRNHGHQLALTAGLSICRGRRVLIIDADLQDPPELIGQMLQMMDAGADVVYGQRRKREGETFFKLLTASLFYRLIQSLTDIPIPRDTGDFRLISRRALAALLQMPERHRFIRGMVCWIGFKQSPILYDRDARFAGVTKYPFRKMLRFAIDAITAFSTKPLKLGSLLGLFFGCVGMLMILYSIISWIFFNAVYGWTSVITAVALLGSMQLFVLGIIGEYLGRLYEEAKNRPLFIIEDVVSLGRHDASPPA